MKYLLLQVAFFACISLFPVFGQTLYTFSNTTASTITTATVVNKTITVSGVPTTGMVLRQVNVSFGNGSGSSSGDMAKITLTLKDPSNNQINILSSASHTTTGDAARTYVNIKFRDHAALKTPAAQATATSSTNSKGYPFYYGYYKAEGSFSTFNTTSAVNGNWTFGITGFASMSTRHFTKVELIFGPPIVVTDIRTTATNLTCATKACLETGSVYWAKNNTAGTNQTSAPANTVGGCAWNASKDNMIWFYFVASQTTAEVSVSGFNSVQESIVVKAPSCGSYTAVTGGCYSDMFNASSHTQKYYNGNWASGYAWNHGYSLTGLTVGHMYMFVIDGSAASNSEYYVELLSGASGGCSPLPIELLDFKVNPFDSDVSIQWETATERDNDFFTISRSADLINWEDIAVVPGSGNTSIRMQYEFTDPDPLAGTSYYQLSQTDYNGMHEEFDPVSVYFERKGRGNHVTVYPNPAMDDFEIKIRAKGCEDAFIQICDLSGKTVLRKDVKLLPGPDKIKIEKAQLEKGMYVVNVTFPNGGNCSTKLVVE